MLKTMAKCGMLVQLILVGIAAYLYAFKPIEFYLPLAILSILSAFVVLFMSMSIIYGWTDKEDKQS